jgi:predicted ATPase
MRIYRLLKELNIELEVLQSILNDLDYEERDLSIFSAIPNNIAILVKGLYSEEIEFFKLIEIAAKNVDYNLPNDSNTSLKRVGYIDLNAHKAPRYNQDLNRSKDNSCTTPLLKYSEKQSFWIDDIVILSPKNTVNYITINSFDEIESFPLYSVLIGTNGVGKSSLMKGIVDFFIDLHACVNESKSKLSSANKGWIKGIRYHIDGAKCEVIRLGKSYFAKINGYIRPLKDLRLPSLVACHFGAFEKFPTQKVNGSLQTKYDVPYYKYVGAHVNGSMISSSAIAFRLLFALNQQMDDRQHQNICSILDFIGYDHRITLSYSLVNKSKKDGTIRNIISQRVKKDKEFSNLNEQGKNKIIDQLYKFYNIKSSLGNAKYNFDIDFDNENVSEHSFEELQYIYKLKQCNLVNSVNVLFHKLGCDISSDEMSSGEFAMLSMVLSISAATNDSHTLILLDEPELSLHPNWQMELIDNLDRALANKVCHLLIATHSHMLVSDLPMKRSSVIQLENNEDGNLKAITISECTYGWSAEEVLLKVFKTATDRNRYFGERIGKLLEKMGNNSITPKEVANELSELQEISRHLSDIDPMKAILNTIIETYK